MSLDRRRKHGETPHRKARTFDIRLLPTKHPTKSWKYWNETTTADSLQEGITCSVLSGLVRGYTPVVRWGHAVTLATQQQQHYTPGTLYPILRSCLSVVWSGSAELVWSGIMHFSMRSHRHTHTHANTHRHTQILSGPSLTRIRSGAWDAALFIINDIWYIIGFDPHTSVSLALYYCSRVHIPSATLSGFRVKSNKRKQCACACAC